MKSVFIILLLCCSSYVSKNSENTAKATYSASLPVSTGTTDYDPRSYFRMLDSIELLRADLGKTYDAATDKKVVLNKASALFIQLISSQMYRHWNGTFWDFYGTTDTPQRGFIACGYFVTTVLRDLGVSIDRRAMAETYSEKMIKTLVQPAFIKKYAPFDLNAMIANMKKAGDAIYLIGLDKHTGFIIVEEGEVWFMHSTVMSPGAVFKERAEESLVLQMNRYGITGKITSDPLFMKNWLDKSL